MLTELFFTLLFVMSSTYVQMYGTVPVHLMIGSRPSDHYFRSGHMLYVWV